MPLVIIKGEYRVLGTAPDGDTVRFVADQPALWSRIPHGVRVNKGAANLRLEGIDALETHYHVTGLSNLHQPTVLAHAAASELLRFLGFSGVQRGPNERITAVKPEATCGFMLSRFADKYGRATAIAFKGSHPAEDGSLVTLDVPSFKKSLNFDLAKAGQAYPTYYTLLYPDLRAALTQAVVKARQARKGLWAEDATADFEVGSLAAVEDELVILPKLFRRLVEFIGLGGGDAELSSFKAFLKAKNDRVTVLSAGHKTGLDNLITVTGPRVRLTVPPEDLMFEEQASTPAPIG